MSRRFSGLPDEASPGPAPSRLALVVALLAATLYGYLFLTAWKGHSGRFVCDFGAHWVAARAALEGHASHVYDQSWFVGQLRSELSPSYPRWSYKYPPIHLLLYAPLAALPHDTALLVLNGLSLVAMASALVLAGATPTQVFVLLAAPVTAKSLFHGQNGLLAGALLGGGCLLLRSRPIAAGLTLSLLSFKPQFLLVAPVALLAGGHRRALLTLVAATLALTLLSAAVFGLAPWERFLGGVGTTVDALSDGQAPAARSFTWTGMLTLAGVGLEFVRPIQALASLLIMGVVGYLWFTRDLSRTTKTLTVLLATPLASPYGIDYDLGVLSIVAALAWNFRDRRGLGPLVWMVPVIWWLPPVTSFLGRTTGIQLAPLCLTAMFLAVALPALKGSPQGSSSTEGC